MAKTVDISLDSIKDSIQQFSDNAQAWTQHYLDNADTYSYIALGAVGLGLILVIVGIILL